MDARRDVLLAACVTAFLLAGIDVGKAVANPGGFPWMWFVVSVAIAAAIIAFLALRLDPSRAHAWRRAIERLSAGESPPVVGEGRSRVLLVALGFAAGIGALCAIRIGFSPVEPVGDEVKQIEAALRWHGFFSGQAAGLPAEPKLTWVLAGAMGGGSESATLMAGKVMALVSVVLTAIVVILAVGWNGGPLRAAAAGVALCLCPALFYSSARFTEDSTLALLVAAGWLGLVHARGRPWMWPVVGLVAGLAAATKGTGFVIVFVLAAAAWREQKGRFVVATALAAALVPLIPYVLFVVDQDGHLKDTEFLGLLSLHGPDALRAMATNEVPGYEGWGAVILDRLGLMTVGDIVVGTAMCFRPPVLWLLPVLVAGAAMRSERIPRFHVGALLAIALPLLGIVAWKGGDVTRPDYLLGPAAALVFGTYADTLLRVLRRSRPLLVLAAILVIFALLGVVRQFIF